ncbi:helix-turn-helix domain-containing protein [Asticcacaulis sp. EMRT-3]|uniref:helix-turn-helix domain-containing protein n=1 Tax=Asticcacaulis sp. EMRT-3 TaxID=3040349 RepID=UPI0024AF08EB|nr:helix-turn-helix domain-containing protein [Asticcacaulis sp. EMRT-3]MDI7775595.1 helix-turn-helix domain-containing protein [Asticcacaulis sp. EMRT-3]
MAGIRRHRNYTVEELARALGKTTQTIRRWIKNGLPVLTDIRPGLIMGVDVIDYMASRKPTRQTCAPDECYCFRCRIPRPCAGGMAEFVPMTATTGDLRALCPHCSTLMHKRTSNAALSVLSALLDISFPQGVPTLSAPLPPSLNDHFKTGAKS